MGRGFKFKLPRRTPTRKVMKSRTPAYLFWMRDKNRTKATGGEVGSRVWKGGKKKAGYVRGGGT